MKKIVLCLMILLLVFVFIYGCSSRSNAAGTNPQEPVANSPPAPVSEISQQLISTIFIEDTDGTDDGVTRLILSMQNTGLDFYQTAASPLGIIASADVVLLKINCQWAERGGTNTDLVSSVIQAIVEHPEGFSGEVIVADNGQAQFGSARAGGSLDWANANALNRDQSVMDVVRSFQSQGYRVTGVLWDEFTGVRVQEFSEGDFTNGFVV
jgi:hypothetical protein